METKGVYSQETGKLVKVWKKKWVQGRQVKCTCREGAEKGENQGLCWGGWGGGGWGGGGGGGGCIGWATQKKQVTSTITSNYEVGLQRHKERGEVGVSVR